MTLQEGPYEFEASLDYIVSFRLAWAISKIQASLQNMTRQKKEERGGKKRKGRRRKEKKEKGQSEEAQ